MKTPNLLFVFPDQMRGSAMGFLGEEPVRTANLDRFAGESLALDNACSNYPLCSPYRAMLMTGKYPFANQVIGNCTSRTAPLGVELQEHDRCWSDVLASNDYSLGYIGKWHLDSPHPPYIDCKNNRGEVKWNEWCPPHRRHGFDFWYSYGTYDFHDRPLYWRNDAAREEFHFVDQWGPEHEADIAIEYLRNEDGAYRNEANPFALVVSMNPPHMPYHLVPPRYAEEYAGLSDEELSARPNIPPAGTKWGDYYRANIRNYYAMITGVDDQFGRIVGALEETGLKDDTIVVFTSDHGDCLGIHDMASKNNPYEESVRVPFLIRWPGQIKAGRDDLLLSTPDIYPTLLELMGFEDDIPNEVEGRSYAEILQGSEQNRPASQLCLSVSPGEPDGAWRAIRNHTHTLIVKRDKIVLHNNINDPFQLEGVAGRELETVASLAAELELWLQNTNDPWSRH